LRVDSAFRPRSGEFCPREPLIAAGIAALKRFEVRTAHSSKLRRLLSSISSAEGCGPRGEHLFAGDDAVAVAIEPIEAALLARHFVGLGWRRTMLALPVRRGKFDRWCTASQCHFRRRRTTGGRGAALSPEDACRHEQQHSQSP
jgi:hypothetical protein